ncbi:tetratricopeptide repeat protein [Sediminitomix flava]|uniref:Tetratricopeptide repeat protein n=1 Tax=Sediminitomix flava TaxID=379075 RepID=A0A315ZCT3_SEDFL|nr:tetratricopeptide repeat protein [Sediminitomix flava]PWJ43361.1 hypothetical protein BC781_102918 [Sediminitomix flava]
MTFRPFIIFIFLIPFELYAQEKFDVLRKQALHFAQIGKIEEASKLYDSLLYLGGDRYLLEEEKYMAANVYWSSGSKSEIENTTKAVSFLRSIDNDSLASDFYKEFASIQLEEIYAFAYSRAEFHIINKRYRRGLEWLEIAWDIDHKDKRLRQLLLATSLLVNDTERFSRYMELLYIDGAGSPETYNIWLEIEWRSGNRNLAISQLKTLLKAFPESEILILRMIQFQLRLDEFEKAQTYLNQLPSTPDRKKYKKLYHALIEEYSNQEESALKSYAQITKEFPNFFEGHYNEGHLHYILALEQIDDLNKKFNKIIKQEKISRQDFQVFRKEINYHLTQALKSFDKAQKIQPENLEILRIRSTVYQLLNKDKKQKELDLLIEYAELD